MRPQRWGKSLIVAPSLLLIETQHSWLSGLISIILIFGILVLASAASYIVNEYFDTETDKSHPKKRHRPLLREEVSYISLVISTFGLFLTSLLLSLFLFPLTFPWIITFIACSILYNIPPIRLKEVPIVDMVIESLNSPIRLNILWIAFHGIEAPNYLSLCFFWINFSLMAMKRFFEISYLRNHGTPGSYRKVYNSYNPKILILSLVVGLIAGNFAGFIEGAVWPFVILVSLWIIYETWKNRVRCQKEWINLERIYTSILFWIGLGLFSCIVYVKRDYAF